jgi:hypothetical protein
VNAKWIKNGVTSMLASLTQRDAKTRLETVQTSLKSPLQEECQGFASGIEKAVPLSDALCLRTPKGLVYEAKAKEFFFDMWYV